MTSNVGSADARRNTAGFGDAGGAANAGRAAAAEKAARYREAVKSWLRPEMLNRIDHVLPFDPLDASAIDRVLDRELALLCRRPGLREVPITLSAPARATLALAGYDPTWGARQLQRAVQDRLVAPIALLLHDGATGSPAVSVETAAQGKLTVTVTRQDWRPGMRPLDAVYDRMVALRGRCRDVLDGPSFAELEAELAAEERRGAALVRHAAVSRGGRVRPVPGARPAAGGHPPERSGMPGRETRDGLRRLRDEIAVAEQEVGVHALMDDPPARRDPPQAHRDPPQAHRDPPQAHRDPPQAHREEPASEASRTGGEPHRAVLQELDGRLALLARSLAALTVPGIGEVVVGIYGDVEGAPLRELAAVYERVATRCGAAVEVGRVHPTLGKAGVFTGVFPQGTVGGKVDPKAAPVGLELVVAGPAAAWMFTHEAGIHAFAQGFVGPSGFSPPLAKEARVSVQTWPVPYAAFVKARPDDLNRRLRFDGTPERQVAVDKLVGARLRVRLPDFSHLEGWLVRSFEARVLAGISG